MHELTEKEIGLVSDDIDREGLTYTLLKDELLDHICCSIEAEMEQGLTFNEAYRKVKQQIGPKRIRQVQDETLYLISKKYRRMKKLMYVMGVAAPILIVIGTILKLQHWPGASVIITLALLATGVFFIPAFAMVHIRDTRKESEPVPLGLYISGLAGSILTIIGAMFKIQHFPAAGVLMTLGLATLALVFLPIYAVVKIRAAREKKVSIKRSYYITGSVAGALLIAGVLFKVMHWPGTGWVIVLSWLAVAVIFLPLVVMNVLKQSERRINSFFAIILVTSFIAVIIMSLIRSPQRIHAEGYIKGDRNSMETAAFMDQFSQALLNKALVSAAEETLQQLKEVSVRADEICRYIQAAKTEMVIWVSDNNRAAISEEGYIDYSRTAGNESYLPAEAVMIGEEVPGKAFELKKMLQSYESLALKHCSDNELRTLISDISGLMSPTEISWEEFYFQGPMMHVAVNLSTYESKVRLIESIVLQDLAFQQPAGE